MAIKPILFNTEMVQAIMDGRKSCTRRVVKPQWEECPHCKYVHNEYIYDEMAENVYCARCGYPLEPERRSPYQPGDILYVRETFIQAAAHAFWYKADDNSWMPEGLHWKPSIHMPKKAARICLKVTNVSVERLQDITGDGAEAEGCFDYTSTALGFPDVWDSTIKKSDLDRYGWDANPYVFVIEFVKIDKPEEIQNA